MALTTIDTNNKLIKFTKEINREFVRENLFSPYMSTDMNAIIRVRNELKSGGEVMNIPFVKRLKGAGVGGGTLVGAEEKIDNYGMRMKVDWARNAVVTTNQDYGRMLTTWEQRVRRDGIKLKKISFPAPPPSIAERTSRTTTAGSP